MRDSWPQKETLRKDKTKVCKTIDMEKLNKQELCAITSVC